MQILAVDDDRIMLEFLTRLVATSGARKLVVASSGAEALDMFAPVSLRPFDAFLFDIEMPDKDGVTLSAMQDKRDMLNDLVTPRRARTNMTIDIDGADATSVTQKAGKTMHRLAEMPA